MSEHFSDNAIAKTASSSVQIGSEYLTIADVVQVARHKELLIGLASDALARVEASAAWVTQTVAQIAVAKAAGEKPSAYYGINTGFGALAGRSALDSNYLTKVLGRNLIASHSVGAGAYFDEEIIRATLLIRAQTLAKGYSGVRPLIIEKLVAMLNMGSIQPCLSKAHWGQVVILRHSAICCWSCAQPLSLIQAMISIYT